MKRLLAVLFCLLLMLALAGCTGTRNPAPVVTLPTQSAAESTAPGPAETEAPTETEPATQAPTETEPETTEPESAPTEAVTHNAKVETLFSDERKVGDQTLYYSIPAISIDGVPVEKVNDAIWNTLYDGIYVPGVEESMEQYGEPGYSELFYDWGEYNGFVSILAKAVNYYDGQDTYYTWNIKLADGSLCSDGDIISLYGYQQDAYDGMVFAVVGAQHLDDHHSMLEFFESEGMENAYYELLAETLQWDNLAKVRPFIGPDGTLFILAPMSTPAGGGHYTQMISTRRTVTDEHIEAIARAIDAAVG